MENNYSLKIRKILSKVTISRFRNLSSGLFYNLVTILSQILLIPIFITLWGKSNYGEWLLLSTIPAYLSISDIGVNVTTTTAICALVAQKKNDEALKLYQSANCFFYLLTSIAVVVFISICFFADLGQWIGIKNSTEFEVEVSLFFLIFSTFISHFIGISLGIYRSEGRFDKYQNMMTGILLSESAITLFNLAIGNNIVGIAISQFIIRLSFWFFIIRDLRKKYQWFYFGIRRIKYVFSLLPTSIYYTTYTTGYNLVIQGTSFFIGKNLGAVNLVTFNTIRTLVNSIRSFTGIFYGSFLPEYTVLIANGSYEKARKLFLNIFTASFFLGGFLVIAYFFLGDWFLYYWTKGKVKIEQPFYFIMLILAFVNTLSNCASTVLNATNKHQIIGIICILLASFSIFTISHLVEFGLQFIAWVLLVFELLLLFAVFYQAWKVTSKSGTIIT